jgi:hypothetical protein
MIAASVVWNCVSEGAWAMSQRASDLANQFEQSSRELVSIIEQMPPSLMQARCSGEQCTVAALASHVAGVHPLAVNWIQTAAAGEPLPEITMDKVDEANAKQTAADEKRDKGEILAALRRNGAEAAQVVRGLSDADLDRSTYFRLFDREMTTEDLVRDVLIADINGHMASIKQASGAD